MRQKSNFFWDGGLGANPQKISRIWGGFSRFLHRIYMHFLPKMKDNDVSEREGGRISKFLYDVTYRTPY